MKEPCAGQTHHMSGIQTSISVELQHPNSGQRINAEQGLDEVWSCVQEAPITGLSPARCVKYSELDRSCAMSKTGTS